MYYLNVRDYKAGPSVWDQLLVRTNNFLCISLEISISFGPITFYAFLYKSVFHFSASTEWVDQRIFTSKMEFHFMPYFCHNNSEKNVFKKTGNYLSTGFNQFTNSIISGAAPRVVSRLYPRSLDIQHATSAGVAAMRDIISSEIKGIHEAGTYKSERVITSKQGPSIHVKGSQGDILNFCANNYLGLSVSTVKSLI